MTSLAPSTHRPPSVPLQTVARWGDRVFDALSLDDDVLLRAASRSTGLVDFGPDDFREPLSRLLHSARGDAQLNAVGRVTLRWSVVRALAGRLRQVEAVARTPSVVATPVRRPILIAAPPRCGTTLLQRLLAAHPDALSLPLWLALDPFPPPDAAEWSRGGSIGRRLRAHAVATGMDALMPAMRAVHTTGADLAVECTWLMLPAFQSVQWMSTWPVHGYADWLVEQRGRGAYRWLRQALQVLQADLPGSHWILKAPGHFAALPTVLETFPDAVVVQLHRDPAVWVGSVASLVSIPHHLHSHTPDYERSVERMVGSLAAGGQAAVDTRTGPDAERFVDIAYRALVDDPLESARQVCVHAGMRWDDEVAAALSAHLARPRKAEPHTYALDAWGLDPANVRRRFAPYIDRFGIPLEMR